MGKKMRKKIKRMEEEEEEEDERGGQGKMRSKGSPLSRV